MLPAVIYAVLVVAGAATLKAFFTASPGSASSGTADQAVANVARYAVSLRWGSFFELGSAIPLGVFVATVVSRLRFLRVRAAGELIALTGGIGAMGMLLLSSLAIWSLTRPGVASAASAVPILKTLSFAAGGPGFVAPLGLFVAGVSIAAGLHRLIPRWLMWLGIVVSVACELATLTLLFWNAVCFIPVGRFIGILWMIGVAATLPSTIAIDRSQPGA